MRDYIERLRAHPIHIRQRIALGATVGVTGLVALVWITSLATSGTLALDLNSSTAVGGGADEATSTVQVAPSKSHLGQLLGAIGAIHFSKKPALDTVDAATSTNNAITPAQTQTTNMNNTSQTSIQF